MRPHEPLRKPINFLLAPDFPVRVRLYEPLLGPTPVDVEKESCYLIALCSKLEILLQGPPKQENTIQINNLLQQITSVVKRLEPRTTLQQYFTTTQLQNIFPNITARITGVDRDTLKLSQFEEYLQYSTALHHLFTMSGQLRYDVNTLNNHKYIAHQIALLYQCLNQIGEPGAGFKKRVEAMFDQIKNKTESDTQSGRIPQLTHEQREWLTTITTDILTQLAHLQSSAPKLKPLIQSLHLKEGYTNAKK